jgi:Uma2 family endonuclease
VFVCGEAAYLDDVRDVLTNPTAIIEVLSPSTENFDRGEKFHRYQTWNPSLKDYVLVSQDQPKIEHFHRGDDGKWSYDLHLGFDAAFAIPAIHCTLKLADAYRNVNFPTQPE